MLLRPDYRSLEKPEEKVKLTVELAMSSGLFPPKKELQLFTRVLVPLG